MAVEVALVGTEVVLVDAEVVLVDAEVVLVRADVFTLDELTLEELTVDELAGCGTKEAKSIAHSADPPNRSCLNSWIRVALFCSLR